jgi:hypothetical protein
MNQKYSVILSWAKAIAREEKRKEANARIIAMNDRIKSAWGKEDIGTIARREGVSVAYVEQIGKRFGK